MNPKTLNININGISHAFPQTTSHSVVIDVCTKLGIDVPRFCYHENLAVAGNCRMCLIEDVKAAKPVVCCAMQATDGLTIFTNTVRVKKARESVLEFLLINHPLDCPICDQGGECDLQDLTLVYGADKGRFYEYKRNVEDKNFGPIVKTIMNRCILCTRCVRFAIDVAGFSSFGVTGRGMKMEIGSYVEKLVRSDLSGNLVDVCPVGALTSKPYSFNARSWEVKRQFTLNIFDDELQILRADVKENVILRVLPAKNENNINVWLADRARFTHEGLSYQRLLFPHIQTTRLSWTKLLVILTKTVLTESKSRSQQMGTFPIISSIGFLVGEGMDLASYSTLKVLKNSLGSQQSYSLKPAQFFLNPSYNSSLLSSALLFLNVHPSWETPLFGIQLKANLGSKVCIGWASEIFNESVLPIYPTQKGLRSFLRSRSLLNVTLQGTDCLSIFSLDNELLSLATENIRRGGFVDVIPTLLSKSAGARAVKVLGLSSSVHAQNYSNLFKWFVYNANYDKFDSKIVLESKTFGAEVVKAYQGSHIDSGSANSNFLLPAETVFENLKALYYSGSYEIVKPLSVVTGKSRNLRSPLSILKTIGVLFGISLASLREAPEEFFSNGHASYSSSFFQKLFGTNILLGHLASPNTYYSENSFVRNSPTINQISLEQFWNSNYKN